MSAVDIQYLQKNGIQNGDIVSRYQEPTLKKYMVIWRIGC